MTMVQTKVNLLHQMDEFIRKIDEDETLLETWLMCGIPDAATEEDFLFFAEDEEEWKDICELFGKLVKRAGKRVYDIGRIG